MRNELKDKPGYMLGAILSFGTVVIIFLAELFNPKGTSALAAFIAAIACFVFAIVFVGIQYVCDIRGSADKDKRSEGDE